MKHIFFFLIIIALALSSVNLEAQTTRHKKKLERAKRKIERIIQRYPELRNTNEVILIEHDTLYNDRIITEIDTITIIRTDTTLPLISISQDSTKFMAVIDTDTFVVDIKTKIITIKEPPKTYYIKDTITVRDTIINTVTKIKEVNIVDTTKDFWFNLWLSIKSWIWWIFIILGLYVILRLILNKIKNKLL